jgi:hypothetical protein
VNESWWVALLREQQGAGFPDAAGAEGVLTIPISERLVTQVVAARIPASLPIAEIQLIAERDNQFVVRVRVSRPAWIPPLKLRLVIARQPQFPSSPVLVLQVASQGLATFAGPLVRMFGNLPPWIALNGEQLHVDVGALLSQYGASPFLPYLAGLELTPVPGRFVVHARLTVRQRA